MRACVERGQPFFGVCRGFQEVNVALGGSLWPEIRDLPGRLNHRMPPDGTLEEKFALRHKVTFTDGGPFHRVLGAREVMTNTLHGQGIKRSGARVRIDGTAPRRHPRGDLDRRRAGLHPVGAVAPGIPGGGADPVSRPLFLAFGCAARAWAEGRRPVPVAEVA